MDDRYWSIRTPGGRSPIVQRRHSISSSVTKRPSIGTDGERVPSRGFLPNDVVATPQRRRSTTVTSATEDVVCCGSAASTLRLLRSASGTALGSTEVKSSVQRVLMLSPSPIVRSTPASRPQTSPETARPRHRVVGGARRALSYGDDVLTDRNSHNVLPQLPSMDELAALPVDIRLRRTYPPDLPGGQLRSLLQTSPWQCIASIRKVLEDTPVCQESSKKKKEDELSLLGRITDAETRQVLLWWSLACSLEAVGKFDVAATLFTRCLSLDRRNFVHAYHRGVCSLGLSSLRAACCDFDLAVSLWATATPLPLPFIVARALAGSGLPDRRAQVWADLETARRRLRQPNTKAPLVTVKSYEEYLRIVDVHQPVAAEHRHWASFLVSRTFGNPDEVAAVSDIQLNSLLGFLRQLPTFSTLNADVLRERFSELSSRYIPPGQPLLPGGYWCCVLHGSLDMVRVAFAADEQPIDADDVRPLALPKALRVGNAKLEAVGSFKMNDTFRGDQLYGPVSDAWLIADADMGATMLYMSLATFRWFRSQCHANKDCSIGSASLEKLCSMTLMQNCTTTMLRSAEALSLVEVQEAFIGEDAFASWTGALCVVLSGRIRCFDGASEVCTLGPGDFVGEDALLGGQPACSNFTRSEVLSGRLEVFIIPTSKKDDLEELGIIQALHEARDLATRELQAKVAEQLAWVVAQPRVVAEVLRKASKHS